MFILFYSKENFTFEHRLRMKCFLRDERRDSIKRAGEWHGMLGGGELKK